MQMDMPMATPDPGGQGQQSQVQQGANPFGNAGGVFMGVDAPGGMAI